MTEGDVRLREIKKEKPRSRTGLSMEGPSPGPPLFIGSNPEPLGNIGDSVRSKPAFSEIPRCSRRSKINEVGIRKRLHERRAGFTFRGVELGLFTRAKSQRRSSALKGEAGHCATGTLDVVPGTFQHRMAGASGDCSVTPERWSI
jgi:hypothetical protein